MRRYELREDQWQKIAPLLPGRDSDHGRTADNRLFVHALLWIARSARRPVVPRGEICQSVLGNGSDRRSDSVFVRFNRWSKKGVWERVFESLQEPDLAWIMTDSTVIRAHRAATFNTQQVKKKPQTRRGSHRQE